MAAEACLVVRSDTSELSRVSRWVDDWARECRLSAVLTHHLDLCASELVANVVDHAHDDDAAHPIRLRLQMLGDRVCFEIEDDGKPFDPVSAPAPMRATDPEHARIGGWGIAIVRHFAEDLTYLRTEAGNRLTVFFRIQ